MKLKNTDVGPRGVYINGNDEKDQVGEMLLLNPGQTSDDVEMSPTQLATAKKTGWFEITGTGSRGPRDDK